MTKEEYRELCCWRAAAICWFLIWIIAELKP